MDAKELLRMNVLKLREEALKIPDVVGVTAMKKEELVKLLANAHGIVLEPKRTTSAEKTEVKQHIRTLKRRTRALARTARTQAATAAPAPPS